MKPLGQPLAVALGAWCNENESTRGRLAEALDDRLKGVPIALG